MWGLFFSWVIVTFLFVLALKANSFGLFGQLPDTHAIKKAELIHASDVISDDGVLLGKYYLENREPVPKDSISTYVSKALIATEDVRFYEHSGIDLIAIVSIPYYLIRGDSRGGSTITQQLAKNLFRTRSGRQGFFEKIPLLRIFIIKLKEWITAIELEKNFSKEEILLLYLNTVDFGNNAFGIKIATKTYFGKSPADLNVEEAAVLVGLLKATTRYNPIYNLHNSVLRRNTVINQMEKFGYLDSLNADSLEALPLKTNFNPQPYSEGPLDYYSVELKNKLTQICENLGIDPYTDGLTIHITINNQMQELAKKVTHKYMRELQAKFIDHLDGNKPWIDRKKKEIPNFLNDMATHTPRYKILEKRGLSKSAIMKNMRMPTQMRVFTYHGEVDTLMSPIDSISYYNHLLHMGLLSVDPFNGQIKTWVGGINFNHFQYDHVKLAKRQPGSTFKPFVYSAALDMGYSPCYTIMDTGITVVYKELEQGKVETKYWFPHNADWKFTEVPMTLRHAIGRSVNTVTVQLSEMIGGWRTVVPHAYKFGLQSRLDTFPSVALGSSELTLYELVPAYGVFINKGQYTKPYLIKHIINKTGDTVYQAMPKAKKVLDENTAWLMSYMLRGTLEEPKGTARGLFRYDLFRGGQVAGKTGTSSDYSDGWFIGVSPQLVTGVWIGADEQVVRFRNNMGEGGKTSLHLFGRFLEAVYKEQSVPYKPTYFPPPPPSLVRKFDCPTILPPEPDSLFADSLLQSETDSLKPEVPLSDSLTF